MKNPNTRVIARNGKHGLDIYLNISGQLHYLTTRRYNGLLYRWLSGDGKSLGEIARIKPHCCRSGQKVFHHAQYLLQLTEDYFRYEVTA